MSTLEDAARAILERWDSQQDMDTKAGEALFEALRAALAEAAPCEKCALWEEIVADEMAETKRMMELGGAREGENFNQLFARLVTERDQFKAEAQADAEPVATFNAYPADWQYSITLRPGTGMLSDGTPLYLHPPRRESAKAELSEEELQRLYDEHIVPPYEHAQWLEFARAVLRAEGGKCQARQHSDQMHCESCGLTWDMNDPHPPKCAAGGEG